MENEKNVVPTEKKFVPTCYTIARVVGDAEVRTGENGKEYRTVPVELLGTHYKNPIHAFCAGTPEIQSFVMVRVQHRKNGFAYTVYAPVAESVQFLTDACTQWFHIIEQ